MLTCKRPEPPSKGFQFRVLISILLYLFTLGKSGLSDRKFAAGCKEAPRLDHKPVRFLRRGVSLYFSVALYITEGDLLSFRLSKRIKLVISECIFQKQGVEWCQLKGAHESSSRLFDHFIETSIGPIHQSW